MLIHFSLVYAKYIYAFNVGYKLHIFTIHILFSTCTTNTYYRQEEASRQPPYPKNLLPPPPIIIISKKCKYTSIVVNMQLLRICVFYSLLSLPNHMVCVMGHKNNPQTPSSLP